MNMELLYITCIFVCVASILIIHVEEIIINYFNSDTFKTIQKHWQAERKSFENALVLILQQDYSHEGMNVYVRKWPDLYKISDGFHFSDNIVDFLYTDYTQTEQNNLPTLWGAQTILLETRLQNLPIMIAPEVTFALASNYLHIESGLGRMVLRTHYILMRNQSNIVFGPSDQDSNKYSPFSFQQVEESGELTIVAQDCIIDGYAITVFSGNTINLGLDSFKISNCKFSVEIYSEGLGSPPVFGEYFSEQQSKTLERMLLKPIRAELLPKLQASVFTYINTSAIFGDKLPKLRFHQNDIFKETSNYMNGIVEKFVQNTINKTKGILQLKPVQILWKTICFNDSCRSCIKIRNVTLYGVDTAYSAHIGGPFKLQSVKLAEAIRFSTIQVRGKIYIENAPINAELDFAVELRDVEVNVEMERNSSSFILTKADIIGWRTLDFSIIDLNILDYERQAAQSFISGYLVNEIPKSLLDHIKETFGHAENRNEEHIDKSDLERKIEPLTSKEINNSKENIKKNSAEAKLAYSQQNDSADDDNNYLHIKEKSSIEYGTESDSQSLSNPSDNENHISSN